MSKLYSRPRTPPSPPPPLSQKSSRSSRLDSKSYAEPSKSYSGRDYDKYGSYDKYERSKYEKSDKFDRYDKLEKSSYKTGSSYLSGKEHGSSQDYSSISHSDKYIGKGSGGSSSYQDDSYRSKGGSLYPGQNYSDRGSYVSKYPPRSGDKYSKYPPSDGKDLSGSKYASHSVRVGLSSSSGSDKKYAPYPSASKSASYSKYGSDNNSYYPKGDSYDSYDSYSRGSDAQSHSGRAKGGGEGGARSYSEGSMRGSGAAKGYSNSNDSHDTYGGGYQRYVIGDSVVYGSPGHYPKDIYPPSPKAKRPRSPHSPPPLLSSSKAGSSSTKGYSRYSSSPKRYSGSALKGVSSSRDDASYSRSSHRKPPSPPSHPYPSHSRNDRPSRNYTPPPDRGKSYDDRFDFGKGGRYYDQREGELHDPLKPGDSSSRDYATYARRKGDSPYLKPYSYQDGPPLRGGTNEFHSRDRYPDRVPKPLMPPKPLLSIPLSVNSIPKESRANLRETLGLPRNRPLNGLDKGNVKPRRLEGRIGSRKRPLSPKDKRRRRPDDLRLWIESRKTESKTNGASSATAAKSKGHTKRPLREAEGVTRSRLLDSRRRILTKGKRKGGGIVRRGMKKPRRPLPPKPKSREDEVRSTQDAPRKSEASGINRDESSSSSAKKRKEKKESGETERERGSETSRGGGGSGKGPGSNANTRRPIKRPRIVSKANSVSLKPRAIKQRSSHRSSQDRDKPSSSSSKNEKTHHTNTATKSKGKDRSRSRSRTRSRSRPPSHSRLRSRSRSRSPAPARRSEKEETVSSSSRH